MIPQFLMEVPDRSGRSDDRPPERRTLIAQHPPSTQRIVKASETEECYVCGRLRGAAVRGHAGLLGRAWRRSCGGACQLCSARRTVRWRSQAGKVRREVSQHPELARAEFLCQRRRALGGGDGGAAHGVEDVGEQRGMSRIVPWQRLKQGSREPAITNGRTSRSGSARRSARSVARFAAGWSPSSLWRARLAGGSTSVT